MCAPGSSEVHHSFPVFHTRLEANNIVRRNDVKLQQVARLAAQLAVQQAAHLAPHLATAKAGGSAGCSDGCPALPALLCAACFVLAALLVFLLTA